MPSIGPMEMVVVLVIALLVIGPKRLPDTAKSLGKGMREFKDSVSGVEETVTTPTPTTTTPAPPAELPSASSDPVLPTESAAEKSERETVG